MIRKRFFRILAVLFAAYAVVILMSMTVPVAPAIGNRCLPPSLRGKAHDDYYFSWLRWIPRSATSWCIDRPPHLILGNQREQSTAPNGARGPKPIPSRGEWQVSAVQLRPGWPVFLPYIAFTTPGGTHVRIGCRWDDVDHYYTFPTLAIATF
jgi:hypothetical protein